DVCRRSLQRWRDRLRRLLQHLSAAFGLARGCPTARAGHGTPGDASARGADERLAAAAVCGSACAGGVRIPCGPGLSRQREGGMSAAPVLLTHSQRLRFKLKLVLPELGMAGMAYTSHPRFAEILPHYVYATHCMIRARVP